MPLTPVVFPGFAGGLNLRDQPNQVQPDQAIDLLNVTFVERSGLRSRDGYSKFTSSALTNQPDSAAAFYTTLGTQQLVVGNGNRLDALNVSGASVANAAPTASPHYFARFGGPTAELMFCANGTDNLRQWNGTAFSVPAYTGTTPTGKFVAVTPWDNRLVNARRSGATAGSNPSSVRFSAAGDPLTWAANDFVDLTPGDGEQIMGVVAWNRYVFVFKETKFFRFYGTSTTGTGTVIFNYEAVDNGVGAVASRAICAGRDGVYFLGRRGVYRTTGSNADLVSPLLDPFFTGPAPDFLALSQVVNQGSLTSAAMAFHREQIYVALPTGTSTTNNRMLVFDPRYGWWSIYDIPASSLASFKVSTQPDLMFGYATGTKDVGRHTNGLTTDDGAAIASTWRSGWSDWGTPQMKTVRGMLVWGKGRLRIGMGTDFNTAAVSTTALDFNVDTDTWGDGTNAADKWADGTNPADVWGTGLKVKPKVNRKTSRGSLLSLSISNSDATSWTVYRTVLRMRPRGGARPY